MSECYRRNYRWSSVRISKSGISFKLQMILDINIHMLHQFCTWKELTNCRKFKNLIQQLWDQETRHFNPIISGIIHSSKVDACFFEVAWRSGSNSSSRIDVIDECRHFVSNFLKVNNLTINFFCGETVFLVFALENQINQR